MYKMKRKDVWLLVSCLTMAVLVLASCTPTPVAQEEPVVKPEEEVVTEEEAVVPEGEVAPEGEAVSPTTTPPDTTPPPAITGLVAADAYDGDINLWWGRSTAEDFNQYNIYVSETEIIDASGMTPVHQIRDIATTTYQVTGLKDGTEYYFAVTALDKSSNENTSVTCSKATPTPMPRGTSDPNINVAIYRSDMAWPGTTLLVDNHNPEKPRIIEVNMLGEVVWEYLVPQNLRQYTNPGFDMELLPNNNVLFLLPGNGVYEIERNGHVVWSYLDEKVSHDADRLPTGNTLVVYGNEDRAGDAQVKEISPEGKIVWAWYASDHFNKAPHKDIYEQGWTHTNAVARLPDGNTLISPRNFHFLVEVNPQGDVVATIGEGIFHYQHDPEVLPNGNILIANHSRPNRAVELDPNTGKIVWQSTGFERDVSPVRDANRLPNGNTLITGSTTIVEVTAGGEIAWQLKLEGVTFATPEDAPRLGFYKAERIASQ